MLQQGGKMGVYTTRKNASNALPASRTGPIVGITVLAGASSAQVVKNLDGHQMGLAVLPHALQVGVKRSQRSRLRPVQMGLLEGIFPQSATNARQGPTR